MSAGKCLVPVDATELSTVFAKDCTKVDNANILWDYNASAKLLVHHKTGLCLDAGTPFSLNCWTKTSPTFAYPMCDTSLSAEQRAADLISRMTLTEKGHNLGGWGGWGGSEGVPRLGVTSDMALQSSEALHGLAQASCGDTTYWPELGGNNSGCPASFPHALALGSTFNRSLWGLIGDRISTEARAAYNTGHLKALWLWAPDIVSTRNSTVPRPNFSQNTDLGAPC